MPDAALPRRASWYIDGVARVACLILVTACSSKASPPAEVVPRDAGEVALLVEDAGDDATDEPPVEAVADPPIGRSAGRQAPRSGRQVDVILRSSPAGATVAVDGVLVGTTPTYWAVDANGRDHEFLFVRKGYAYARYRFVPITSGVVHARLEPIAEDSPGGMPPELMQHPLQPAAPRPTRRVPPAAVPALVSPDAGAPATDATELSPDAAPADPAEAATGAGPLP